MYQENPLDRWSRIILAWMVWAERIIEIDLWYLWRTWCIEVGHLWRLSLIKAQSLGGRFWIELYYDLISPTLMLIGLKRVPTWAELEEQIQQLERQTGKSFPRTPAHIAGLEREQAKRSETT